MKKLFLRNPEGILELSSLTTCDAGYFRDIKKQTPVVDLDILDIC